MKEVQITAYISEDGRQFTDKTKCIAWENEIKDARRVTQKYNDIIDYCHNHVDEGDDGCQTQECPFYNIMRVHNCLFCCLPYIDFDKIEG